ncbi:anti-sigma factor family protein [Streptomyces sp. NPDC002018]|uniref:anti-sigma factor family protein n=1 Tax=Streptomyces sp. NPDC002018 TaxID=3364629 RepID=UPI0036B69625
MTSTADMTQHPDVSEISDLAEGLLPPARAADIRNHLDGCALCADVHESLEEIRGLLGTLPGPPRMPTDVAERIDAALAAEALLNATAPDEAAHVSRETSHPSGTSATPDTRSATDVPSAADSPAAPAEPSAPDASPMDALRADRPAGRPRAATGPGRTVAARRRRRTAVLGAVLGTAAVGVSVLLLQSISSSGTDTADKQAGSTMSATKSDSEEFTEARLQSSVDTLLASGSAADPGAKQPESRQGGSPRDGGPSNSPLFQPMAVVPPCIEQGIGRTEPVLAAQEGVYEGSPAYLVVLSHSTDSSQIQAYVVDATCVGSPSPTEGKVLLTHAYPRR